jgi:hypothetical protein
MPSQVARKVLLPITELLSPVGYGVNGANGATPYSQFVCRESLPTYYNKLCQILKTVFDRCEVVMKSLVNI